MAIIKLSIISLHQERNKRIVDVALAELQMVSDYRHKAHFACFVQGSQADVIVHVEI